MAKFTWVGRTASPCTVYYQTDKPPRQSRLEEATLHAFVIRAATALWHNPRDNLIGVSNVARLAMNAVGKVDFQFLTGAVFHHFIHSSRAKILAGIAVFLDAFCRAYI